MKKQNRWIVHASHADMERNTAACAIAEDLGISLPTAELLYRRGCETPEAARDFLSKKTEQLHDPFLMKDMETAAVRILSAVEDKEKIVIYGDYDVDGVTAVSCLYLYLKELEADVSYYIPSRLGEGYGMSEGSVKKLADAGNNLIITVDTGITATAEAQLIKELGMELIVTDHHECHSEIPDAEAVVNPKQSDCPYPFKELAGVGVVFKLLCALEIVLNPEKTMTECVRRVARDYGDLVAIGTIADVMPVRDENRLIVSYGLALMEAEARPGIVELMDASRSDNGKSSSAKKKITASLIGYTIAPRINAAGRIRNASLAVELFLAEDCEQAAPIARELCEINKERQNEENTIVEAAYAQIVANHDFDKDPVVVLDDETWHHGIIGIVASRITEKYNCPTILLSFEGNDNVHDPENERWKDDIGKGSGRSIKGMNLVDALAACSDLLVKFGGHELAAGLTIRRENLLDFKERINEYARGCLSGTDNVPAVEAECELIPAEITMEQVNELYYLEPYGVSNPVPVFYMGRLPILEMSAVGGGKHVRMNLKIGKQSVCAMAFRMTVAEIDAYPGDIVDVLFTLDINEFQGNTTLQLIVKDIRLTSEQYEAEEKDYNISELLIAGEKCSLTVGEHIRLIPTREECGVVYSQIKYDVSVHHQVYTLRAFCDKLKNKGYIYSPGKIRLILHILEELQLIEMSMQDGMYVFENVPAAAKTNLENSSLYKRLITDYPR